METDRADGRFLLEIRGGIAQAKLAHVSLRGGWRRRPCWPAACKRRSRHAAGSGSDDSYIKAVSLEIRKLYMLNNVTQYSPGRRRRRPRLPPAPPPKPGHASRRERV